MNVDPIDALNALVLKSAKSWSQQLPSMPFLGGRLSMMLTDAAALSQTDQTLVPVANALGEAWNVRDQRDLAIEHVVKAAEHLEARAKGVTLDALNRERAAAAVKASRFVHIGGTSAASPSPIKLGQREQAIRQKIEQALRPLGLRPNPDRVQKTGGGWQCKVTVSGNGGESGKGIAKQILKKMVNLLRPLEQGTSPLMIRQARIVPSMVGFDCEVDLVRGRNIPDAKSTKSAEEATYNSFRRRAKAAALRRNESVIKAYQKVVAVKPSQALAFAGSRINALAQQSPLDKTDLALAEKLLRQVQQDFPAARVREGFARLSEARAGVSSGRGGGGALQSIGRMLIAEGRRLATQGKSRR